MKQFRDWVTNVADTYYVIGSVVGLIRIRPLLRISENNWR